MRLLLAGLLVCALSFGQRASDYDSSRKVHLEGAVTRIDWVNPRAFVFIDVKDKAGTVLNWAVEIGNPLELERSKWSAASVKIGDTLVIDGVPARDASRKIYGTSVLAGARKLFTLTARPALPVATPAPRWPSNGHPRLGPAPGERGYWEVIGTPQLRENVAGAVAMDAEGLLKNLNDADRVAPFQPWAKALYDYRQTNELEPHTRCKPSGFSREFMTPYGVEFVEMTELQRMYIFDIGGPHTFRTIYMDGRSHPDNLVPSNYGHSIGWWEGDTFVVDSVGFNEDFWLDRRGLPHTEQLHTIERFTRTDKVTIDYKITIDDPGAYTKPYVGGFNLRYNENQELFEYVCQQANYAHELMVGGESRTVSRSSPIVP